MILLIWFRKLVSKEHFTLFNHNIINLINFLILHTIIVKNLGVNSYLTIK